VLLRILDANFNRAREAIRMLEDIARFSLNDADLASGFKTLRHDLTASLETTDSLRMLAHRDTPHDVGTQLQTRAEYQRESLHDIAAASAGRLSESLRAIEECLKGQALTDEAKRVEQARYAAYALDQRLRLALGTGRQRQWRVCVLITASLCKHPWLDVARAAIDGGADCLQLREKNLDGGELLERATLLVQLAKPRGCSVIINDSPDIAILADADGVHVGQTDLPISAVQRLAGKRLLVGVSTSNPLQARAAASAGADLCGVGPMFATTTKHKPDLAGPAYLREYLAEPHTARIPHLAIGGITPENIRELSEIGCLGVAVSSVVCSARDPAAVVAQLLAALPATPCNA
jgi:thiamine-phosphate pyrophosphorylase